MSGPVTTQSGTSEFPDVPDEQTVEELPGARRFPTGWVSIGLLVGALLGLGAGLLVPVITRPGDSSVEAGFLRDMSTHHAQAVEMSMLVHRNGTDRDVRTLGGDIALMQHGQIGIMQTWLRGWGLDPTGSDPPMAWMPEGSAGVRNGLMPGMASAEEITKLRAAVGRNADVQFLQLMLQHHLGGIHMAEEIIKISDTDEVTELAGSMVAGQQEEIELIQSLQQRLAAPG